MPGVLLLGFIWPVNTYIAGVLLLGFIWPVNTYIAGLLQLGSTLVRDRDGGGWKSGKEAEQSGHKRGVGPVGENPPRFVLVLFIDSKR